MKKLLLLVLLACDDPTMMIVDNTYADGTAIDATWWSETYVPDVIAPGTSSPTYRTIPSEDYAYAVIDRGGELIAVRTKDKLTSERGATLHVTFAATSTVGDCATGETLTQAEADLVTQSIFPDIFANTTYDAATCKLVRSSPLDASPD